LLEHRDFILDYFDLHNLSLRDRLEVIANVLIGVGCIHIPAVQSQTTLTQDNIIDLVLEDREQNGETVANATVIQGLQMLSWLNQ
jgi:hypothetical protein